ncbi:unnamed protein product [Ilex paraguariensis]|uniref:DUF7903 domain-containing protein n=1 Tax=Ilex paraguariensis TaxID=185542 RepID=A0ABC8U0F4_9AQUA
MEYAIKEAVPKVGLEFEKGKELYHVKLSDNLQPGSTISCKCRVAENQKKLELYKIELNQVRHLVADMSCLDKSLDLRLMLCTKRIITTLTDDEVDSIRSLVSSATLDPEVKGGLRWRLGKESSGDRYTVVGVWHINAKIYRGSSIRLKIRDADRFDFLSSSGEVTCEVTLKMTSIVSNLLVSFFVVVDSVICLCR